MSNHDDFKMLSALAAVGQISSEEEQTLREHLAVCVDCREAHAECLQIVAYDLPGTVAELSRFKFRFPRFRNGTTVRERFLNRARSEGIFFSPEVQQTSTNSLSRWTSWQWPTAVLALSLLALVAASVTLRRSYSRLGHSNSPNAFAVGQGQRDSRALTELSGLHRQLEAESAELDRTNTERVVSEGLLRLQLNHAQQRVEVLSAQLQHVQEESRAVLAELQRRIEENSRLSAEIQEAVLEKSEVASANQKGDELVANLRSQIKILDRERNLFLATSATQQARIRQLSEDLERRGSDLDRERQLMSVSNEVRQLMGARKLHIIDVNDLDGRRNPKAFGRVFYAEGQSLIFYAFDLPGSGVQTANLNFQVWGARESSSQFARNLGTLADDDHEQRRWVLKIDDPTLFSGIDSVFVTAESKSASGQPRGKKLLYAYIAGQPNHP